MNKLLELSFVGLTAIIFSIFLMVKEHVSFYTILLFITGIGILLYGFYKKKEISDFDDSEVYDERDEIIRNKASNIILTILTYVMLILLLINNVKEFRVKLNLTQVGLAKAVNVSSRTIISIEAQKYNPTLELAFKLAKALDATIIDLFEYKREE